MKKIAIVAVAAIALVSCNSGDSGKITGPSETAINSAPAGEWTALFDGHSLKGWHQYGESSVSERWKVSADSTVYIDTAVKKSNGDLVTDDAYENFDLTLEWKIAPRGNSGIIFYVIEDPGKYKQTYETGPEMQVVDNEGHPDGKLVKHQAGDLYDMISCSKKTVKPVGAWNQVEIKAINGKLDFYLNGENVVSTTMWDADWNQLIAGSKFKNWPGFGMNKKGKIALQDHGDAVWYRNIKIKRL